MSLLHTLVAFSKGGVSGLQAAQSDWSPYAVHFTSFKAMTPVREAVGAGKTPGEIQQLLEQADAQSLDIARAIIKTGGLRASSPAQEDEIPPCICLCECVIGGLISNAERYGRFGFVFEKTQLFPAGGPCLYLNDEEYTEIVRAFKASKMPVHQRIFGRSNLLSPAGIGNKVQDFSHEREWRVFADIEFSKAPPKYVLAPKAHLHELAGILASDVYVIPLDTMFEWGA